MANYINVSGPNSNAILQIQTSTSVVSTTSGYVVPALQDITINNQAGVFSWSQLDRFAQLNVPTPATNSISGNMVIDSAKFFGATNGVPGLFDLQNDAEYVYFRVYFNGNGTGSKYVAGSGYITNLAPTVNPGAPVWVSPLTISVDGDLTAGTV
jgi:hypothetical protein